MLNISVKGLNKVVRDLEREKDRVIGLIARDTLEVAKKNTPIDKGQARRGWRLTRRVIDSTLSGTDYDVTNSVPHAVYLEQGRSKQAPNGILGPTVREIAKRKYSSEYKR